MSNTAEVTDFNAVREAMGRVDQQADEERIANAINSVSLTSDDLREMVSKREAEISKRPSERRKAETSRIREALEQDEIDLKNIRALKEHSAESLDAETSRLCSEYDAQIGRFERLADEARAAKKSVIDEGNRKRQSTLSALDGQIAHQKAIIASRKAALAELATEV